MLNFKLKVQGEQQSLKLQFECQRKRLVAFAFFAGDTLKVRHLGCNNWGAYEPNIINLSYISTRLIILYIDLYVLYILEFHISEINGIAVLQLLLNQAASSL